MTAFTQDKIFKNVNDKDARIILDILGIKSNDVHIWTKELRLIDPKDFRPDIILELDSKNLIVELQSRKVDDDFSARGLTYVAVTNREKENDKEVDFITLSSAEESKTVHYPYNSQNVFKYNIVGLNELDADEIISTVEPKIQKHDPISGKELVLYSLVPIIKRNELEIYTKQVVNNLLKLKNITTSLKDLSYGIAWLTVDKYITDEEMRNILCDALGDNMSLIHEYGERKEQKGKEEGMKKGLKEGKEEGKIEGKKEVIISLIKSGMNVEEISDRLKEPLEEIQKIKKQNVR